MFSWQRQASGFGVAFWVGGSPTPETYVAERAGLMRTGILLAGSQRSTRVFAGAGRSTRTLGGSHR